MRGTPAWWRTCRPPCRDHPRVCGEHRQPAQTTLRKRGSSPRMRGTHRHRRAGRTPFGIIPAYAGNTNELVELVVLKGDHPRVCGEHRPVMGRAAHRRGSSPRMRGTRCGARERQDIGGIIPAYAGNTGVRFESAALGRDHPRVCGEHTAGVAVPPM